jgi:AcrR family transcriptional regulator
MTEQDIHTQILEAAEARFNQYGYNKTTMAEIACDCDMSAANLYRYFKNKLDIGAAISQQCLDEKEQLLAAVVHDGSLTASEKLEAFVLKVLHYTYNHFDVSPKLSELVEAMSDQRPDMVAKHSGSKLKLLSDLVEQGQKSGEFQLENVDEAAEAIQTAILLFYYPLTLKMYPLEVLELKAINLCRLLLAGLTTR